MPCVLCTGGAVGAFVGAMVRLPETFKSVACGEKQKTLHGSMGEEMKNSGAISADPTRENHKPELADC